MVVMTARPPVASWRREESRCMAVVASCPDHTSSQMYVWFSEGRLLHRNAVKQMFKHQSERMDIKVHMT